MSTKELILYLAITVATLGFFVGAGYSMNLTAKRTDDLHSKCITLGGTYLDGNCLQCGKAGN